MRAAEGGETRPLLRGRRESGRTPRRAYGLAVITYTSDLSGVLPSHLEGFFVGWPHAPSPDRHLAVLEGSRHVVLAREGTEDRVVGFVTAVGDGVLSAYIPLLEVLPEFQGRGIGTELVRRLLADLVDLYMVDLCCDEALVPFYERLGFRRWDAGMGFRRHEAAAGGEEGGAPEQGRG